MKPGKRMTIGVTVACVALLGGAIFGGVADAKKKKKKNSGTATVSKTLNQGIPDRVPFTPTTNPPAGTLLVPLSVSKKFKGKTVANVDVTFQTTGQQPDSASDLEFFLSAPSGDTYEIDGNGFGGQSIGPVTMSSHTATQTCGYNPAAPPPYSPVCSGPTPFLNPPFVGVARDTDLPNYRGLPMMGTWTFWALDVDDPDTSILNSVKLVITAQKPIK
jgi:hypothetical protein